MSSILYIEDDIQLSEIFKRKLGKRYKIDIANDYYQGIKLIQSNEYNLIILDYFLKDKLGLEILSFLRQELGSITPVLFLTQNIQSNDVVAALDEGADDYLTKPFDFNELTARIRVLIRRSASISKSSKLSKGKLLLDQNTQQVWYDKQEIYLRHKEFLILEHLMLNLNRIISRVELFEHIWPDKPIQSNTVDVHILRLRSKIEKPFKTKHIEAIYGEGYKLI